MHMVLGWNSFVCQKRPVNISKEPYILWKEPWKSAVYLYPCDVKWDVFLSKETCILSKETYFRLKETYILSNEDEIQNMRCFIWDIHIRQSDPNKTYFYQKRPVNTSKEPYILWKEPWKRPLYLYLHCVKMRFRACNISYETYTYAKATQMRHMPIKRDLYLIKRDLFLLRKTYILSKETYILFKEVHMIE